MTHYDIARHSIKLYGKAIRVKNDDMSSNIKIKKICLHCGQEFIAKTTVTKYCSHKCNSRHYKLLAKNKKIDKSNINTIQLKTKSIEEINAKEFLSVDETVKLLGISRSTIYRMFKSGMLPQTKIGGRTIVRRKDIDDFLFIPTATTNKEKSNIPDFEECYTLGEIQKLFNVSEKALYTIINRNNINKFQKGKHVYVEKEKIEKIFS
jgi:excisionase family DNA binding protein